MLSCCLSPDAMDATDVRHARLAELRRQLAELNARGRLTKPNSPERDAVLEEWAPVNAAVLALADELDDES
jgi:hypothetical protein